MQGTTSAEAAAIPERRPRLDTVVLAIGLLAFTAVVAFGISVHEPWFDEAHAWLLARDATTVELLTKYLRYEGHPPLWYLILEILTTLRLPYASLNITSGLIATIGTILLFRLDRVPLPVKLLMPFTYFLAYQYAVVARSYVLLFPLLVSIIHIYTRRAERVWTFALLLVLLSNVSVHGLAMAGVLTLLYMIDIARGRQSVPPATRRRQFAALAVLALNVAILVAVLMPPSDLAIRPTLDYRFSVQKMMWIALASLVENLYGETIAAFPVLMMFGVWLHRRGRLLEFLLLLAAVAAIVTVYFNMWHEGLFVLVLFFGMLLAYARPARVSDTLTDRRLTIAVTAALCAALAQHIVWTSAALRFDADLPYSGSRAAAEFIDRYDLHQRKLYAAGFAVISVQPYFETNIFDNYRPRGGYAFLDWTTESSLYLRGAEQRRRWMGAQMEGSPEFFLISQKFAGELTYRRVLDEDPRYRLVAAFPGGLFWKTHVREREQFFLYGRVDALRLLH